MNQTTIDVTKSNENMIKFENIAKIEDNVINDKKIRQKNQNIEILLSFSH